jgi:acetylornithine deacetylase/succinyl-diaminopimelate desuccinylase-like protein
MEVEKILSEMVQIHSVNPPGGETAVAEYLKGTFEKEGISGEVIESAPGRGNFIVSIGEGEKKLLFFSHLDVVPASTEWDFDPFGGEIKDGFVHGRGSIDCKALAAAEIIAALRIAERGKLNGQLILVASADEETGGSLGAKYLTEKYPERLNADFAVNEGGWNPITINGKTCHFIQTGEKGICWQKLSVSGISAHGSLPWLGDNAVAKIATAIKTLYDYQPEIVIIPEVKRLIEMIAQLEGFTDITTVNENNVDCIIARLRDDYFAATLKAITRMSVSPNVVWGGSKTNIVADSAGTEVDIRILPGQDEGYVHRALDTLLGDLVMETTQSHEATFSTSETPYYKLIAETTREVFPGVTVLPCVSSGSTDSKYLRSLGVPAYGIGTLVHNLDPVLKTSVHGRNEKMDIESLTMRADFLFRLAQKYLEE